MQLDITISPYNATLQTQPRNINTTNKQTVKNYPRQILKQNAWVPVKDMRYEWGWEVCAWVKVQQEKSQAMKDLGVVC
jgi:hypothetical protein